MPSTRSALDSVPRTHEGCVLKAESNAFETEQKQGNHHRAESNVSDVSGLWWAPKDTERSETNKQATGNLVQATYAWTCAEFNHTATTGWRLNVLVTACFLSDQLVSLVRVGLRLVFKHECGILSSLECLHSSGPLEPPVTACMCVFKQRTLPYLARAYLQSAIIQRHVSQAVAVCF